MMRIVIDMQGAQTVSRFRGIGRYTMSLTQAIARNQGDHELILALNSEFTDTIEPIRAAFRGLLPPDNIHLWRAPGPTRAHLPANRRRIQVAERLREAFMASLFPDVILISSLFEGWRDDAATSVGVFDQGTAVAAIQYDLIPLNNPDEYLDSVPFRNFYYQKLTYLKKCDGLLAISEHSRRESLQFLSFDEQSVTNISGACDSRFRKKDLTESERMQTWAQVGISRPFVLYMGGSGYRKNLSRLAQAYSALPGDLKAGHQLVFCGYLDQDHINELRALARSLGVSESDFIIKGHLEEDILLNLLNSCTLFVLPSLAEGFGLSALEAMACGAPMIASNTTSLPEVVGNDDLMFDPFSVSSIRDKMVEALSDIKFRQEIASYGLKRAELFSWDKSAVKAIEAIEGIAAKSASRTKFSGKALMPPKITFDKQAQKIILLLCGDLKNFITTIPAISKLRGRYPYAAIDAVVNNSHNSAAKALGIFNKIFTIDYDKDFSDRRFPSDNQNLKKLMAEMEKYDLAIDFNRDSATLSLLSVFRADLKVGFRSSDDEINDQLDIVVTPLGDSARLHISQQKMRLVDALPGKVQDYVGLPEVAPLQVQHPGRIAVFPAVNRKSAAWPIDSFKTLATELINDDRIEELNVYLANINDIKAFCALEHAKLRFHIALEYDDLVDSLSGNAICIAADSDGAHLSSYLGLAVIVFYDSGEQAEEWAPVFGPNVCILPNDASPPPVELALDAVWNMWERLNSGCPSATFLQRKFGDLSEIITDLSASIASVTAGDLSDSDLLLIARELAAGIKPSNYTPQLFLDISKISVEDAKTGIQRVVRSLLSCLLKAPLKQYNVVPIYFDVRNRTYFHAVKFTREFLGQPVNQDDVDVRIEFHSGDIYLSLDLNFEHTDLYGPVLSEMHRAGVEINFIVYDLLCVTMTDIFIEPFQVLFRRWLNTITKYDGAFCISRATADELYKWMQNNTPNRLNDYRIEWFHIGADIENSNPSTGLPDQAPIVFSSLKQRPSFLMVSTLEPRKGYDQALAAFDELWENNIDVNLVIVGKRGWLVDKLIEKLENHTELNRRLFWLAGISDEYLEKLYEACTCLISASRGEGFGLSLVEAAQHKMPIIARDLAVFREIAGKHAFYFSGSEPEDLAKGIQEWLKLYKTEEYPKSDEIPCLTWAQSTGHLLEKVFRNPVPTAVETQSKRLKLFIK